MKKIFLFMLALAAVLSVFSGCGSSGDESNFSGIILEINGSTVLVQALEGDAIRSSADKISFSKESLDDIGAESGDTVTVAYTGGVMETYPAQVSAVSWSILKRGETVSAPTPPVSGPGGADPVTAEYSYEDKHMSVTLPDGWDYEILAYTDGETAVSDSGGSFGIIFWPAQDSSLRLSLTYHMDIIGICGTGVTFTEMEFASGLSATACTEQIGDEYWFFLIYGAPNEGFTAECTVSMSLWTDYEDEIMSILDTIMIESA